ncbi:hypothetical protein K505DRAFT_341446 [Melanomma pulvis-pyrius CBS 109.77]|uniref:CFEM domain-containing protein n=1 Tax=Melanomma pulvis-pyrius CBS 109.77 TaxID=1314802 RepID=A0A6A6WYR2_9PLEO|nr:hypothetical protein K505DRAFT_341446 [Melanomma pulvis-pyrius CBS 109.77]
MSWDYDTCTISCFPTGDYVGGGGSCPYTQYDCMCKNADYARELVHYAGCMTGRCLPSAQSHFFSEASLACAKNNVNLRTVMATDNPFLKLFQSSGSENASPTASPTNSTPMSTSAFVPTTSANGTFISIKVTTTPPLTSSLTSSSPSEPSSTPIQTSSHLSLKAKQVIISVPSIVGGLVVIIALIHFLTKE